MTVVQGWLLIALGLGSVCAQAFRAWTAWREHRAAERERARATWRTSL